MRIFCTEESEGCMQESIRLVLMEMGGILQMELPEGFRETGEEKMHQCYPCGEQPDILLEGCDGVQMTGRFTERKLETDRIRPAAEEIREMAEETFPEYGISPVYLCTEGEMSVGWFRMEMTGKGFEHVKAIGTAEGRMVMLTFTYPEAEAIKWRSILRQSFRTWRVCNGKN